jgi:aryl-alcohol dehydrogenase-like predicted oxidoreductase
MPYRTLGQKGLQLSEVGLGAMPVGGMVSQADGTQFGWTGMDDREYIALVHRGEELGVNLLETAEAYGSRSSLGAGPFGPSTTSGGHK